LLLRTVLSAWMVAVEYSAQDRVGTRHKVTFVMRMPRRYAEDIKALPGVSHVAWFDWFGGHVPGKEDQFFGQFATDPKSMFDVYPEISVPEDQKQAWFADRRGAIVGATLARQFGWKVGQRIQLEGSIYPGMWEFNIDGIYHATRKSVDQSSFYFQWDYLNEGALAPQKDQIGWIITKIPDASQAAATAKKIDALFEPRDIQTLSMSEHAMTTSFLGMMGTLLNAMQIVSLVILLIMLLILGNTIAMGVRERTHEYGVLRAIGFLPRHLTAFVLGEAVVLGLLGGLVGLAIGIPLINLGVGRVMEENFTAWFPYFRVAEHDAILSVALSIVLALVAAAVPAYQTSRLHVTNALRKVG
jgi:putative ABC transport system permease protein